MNGNLNHMKEINEVKLSNHFMPVTGVSIHKQKVFIIQLELSYAGRERPDNCTILCP